MKAWANIAQRQEFGGDWWIDGDSLWLPAHLWDCKDLSLNYSSLGLVRVRLRQDRVVLLWDIDRVEPSGLESALAFLSRLSPARSCCLRYCKGGWAEEWHDSHFDAVDRIKHLQRSLRTIHLFPGVSIHRQSLGHLSRAHHWLRDTFVASRHLNALDWAKSPLGRTGILFERHGGALIYRHVGADSEIRRVLGETWYRTAVGRPVNDAFTDPEFNRRINATYDLAMKERQPVVEEILANVDAGYRRILLPYSRLTLPVGEHLIVVVKFYNGLRLDEPDTAYGRSRDLEVA